MNNPSLRIATFVIALVSFATSAISFVPANAQDKPDDVIILAEGTPLNVVTAQEISSKTANAGDDVSFKVEEDLVLNNHLVISKGTSVKGSVINAEPKGNMGRSGKLGIQVQSTTTVDGQPIKLRAAKGGEGASHGGSVMALSMLVGPFAILKKGTDAKINEGTRVTVYVAEERRFRVEGANLVALSPAEKPADANAVASAAGAERTVTVFIYRPEKMMGGALEPSVFCDDVELARMDNGRYVTLKLKPGKHMIRMTDKKKSFAIEMGGGEEYYFRVGIEAGMWKGQGKLTLEDKEKAVADMKKLKPIGKDKIKDHTMVVEGIANGPAAQP